MESGKVVESVGEEKDLDQPVSKKEGIDFNTETTQQNSNDRTQQSIDEGHPNDSETVIRGEPVTEENAATNADDTKSNISAQNEEADFSELNRKAETEKNSKKHSLILYNGFNEQPDAKKCTLEYERENNVVADSPLPISPEFYKELESYDCDPGSLWHFDDPYFIELVQVGNPPKDVAYVRLRQQD